MCLFLEDNICFSLDYCLLLIILGLMGLPPGNHSYWLCHHTAHPLSSPLNWNQILNVPNVTSSSNWVEVSKQLTCVNGCLCWRCFPQTLPVLISHNSFQKCVFLNRTSLMLLRWHHPWRVSQTRTWLFLQWKDNFKWHSANLDSLTYEA